jgi:hypothetical protein
MQDLGHWETTLPKFNIEDWCGFIYKITNTTNNKKYLGKKFFFMTTRKKVKNRINRKKIIKESDWKTYTGSSKSLNVDINLIGKENFKFEILSLHESRSTLAYTEIKTLVMLDALRKKMKNGEKEYYNGLIPPCKFIPNDETILEEKFKIIH